MKYTEGIAKLEVAFPLLVGCTGVLGGEPRPGELGACASCGGCGVGLGFLLLIPIILIIINVILLIWVARDAKARGMDNAVMWMILVMLTGFLGLIIYIFSRPNGNLIPCATCGNRRLETSAKCPHCGNS